MLHCRPLLRPNYRGSALNHHTGGGGGGLGVHTQCVTHAVVVSLAKDSKSVDVIDFPIIYVDDGISQLCTAVSVIVMDGYDQTLPHCSNF